MATFNLKSKTKVTKKYKEGVEDIPMLIKSTRMKIFFQSE